MFSKTTISHVLKKSYGNSTTKALTSKTTHVQNSQVFPPQNNYWVNVFPLDSLP